MALALGTAAVVAACTGTVDSLSGPTAPPASPTPSVLARTTDAPPSSTAPAAVPTPALATGPATAVLAALPVKGRAPRTGYSRTLFTAGSGGTCSVRDEILAAQLQHVVRLDGCRVGSGDEIDPYTGAPLTYRRGESTVDVDHVVALGDAWQKGARQWTAAQRAAFASDPLNLLAVSAAANRQKGDSDAASWLPRAKGYRCAYVARQIAVKSRYHLWVTGAERDAMDRVLARCPGQQVPDRPAGRAPAALAAPVTTPSTTLPTTPAARTSSRRPTPHRSTPRPVRASSSSDDCTPGYDPCVPIASDVDCAGGSGNGPVYVQGPIRVTGSDPYRLDSDHDGIGCE